MKRKLSIILALSATLTMLTACSKDENIQLEFDPNMSVSTITSYVLIQTEAKQEIPQATQQPITSNLEQHSQKQPETTSAPISQEQQLSNETTVSNLTDIFESELLSETVKSGTTDFYPEEITKYIDKYSGKEFIILNVTTNKIYWNELDGYDIAQGQSLDIPIPAIFEDWVSDTDEIMIYLSDRSKTFGDLLFDGEKNIKGMTYPQYWSTDYLCPIKNGVVCFGEFTDNIKKSFSRVDDGVYIEEANSQYSETPFANNMSVSNLDTYFETIKKDYDSLMQKMADNPDTSYDVAGLWGYQDGIRFRATINNIY